MSDYDDLFDNNDEIKQEIIYTKTSTYDSNANDFYKRAEEDKRNGLLFLIYILISLLISFLGGVINNSEYGYLAEAIDEIQTTQEINFIVSDNIDPDTNAININNPYLITLTGEYINNYDLEIPVFNVQVEFFDIAGESIGMQIFTTKEMQPGETFLLNEELTSSLEPIEIETTLKVDSPSIFYTVIGLVQVTIATALFFVVDKLNFKKDWEEFKNNRRQRIRDIFRGFLLVYVALIISNLLLTVLGVTGTSENEMTIQSLFSEDPLELFLLFLLLTVFTPIVEEIIFRKVLFNFVEPRTNYKFAIAATGLIFGLMHVLQYGDFIQSIPYVMMGFVFGYIYWKSNKNIYVVIGVHFLNNFLSWLIYVLTIYGFYL